MSRVIKYFKLASSISMKNMVGFNEEKMLVKMNSVGSIIQKFYDLRFTYY